MMKREEHFSTPQQVGQYLAQSLKIVENAEVPEDLRQVAFAAVFNAVSGKQVFFEQAAQLPDLAQLRHGH